MYVCQRCNKCFNRKNNLERHLNNKTTCIPVGITKGHICNYCDKTFSRSDSLKRHQNNKNTSCYVLKNIRKEVQIQQRTPTIINNVNNVINVINVQIVNPGEEKIDHLTNDKLLNILDQEYSKGVRELMRLVYFNKDVPENHHWCIIFPNNEYGALQYNSETRVIERWLTDKIIDDNFVNMISLLLPKMNDISRIPNLSQTQRRNISMFYQSFGADGLSNEFPADYRDIKMMAYNNRNIPVKLWSNLGIDGEHRVIMGLPESG